MAAILCGGGSAVHVGVGILRKELIEWSSREVGSREGERSVYCIKCMWKQGRSASLKGGS
jgi:hypothetical protein